MNPTQALPAVLDKIDAELDNSLARLFEFLKIQSISTDPAYKDQCKAAAEYVAKDLAGIGFDTSVRPTDGHPIVVGKGERAGQRQSPARSVLRPLRRAAGRSARHVGDAAVCAAHRDAAGRPKDHRRARRLRRQRPGDDLRRGVPCVQGDHRQPAAADHHDDRGRGGVRLGASVRLRQGQCRRVQARPRAGLRHQHVGRGDADGDDLAARAGLRGGEGHLCRPRSAFRPVRRRGAKSAARAGAHSRGDARQERACHYSGLLQRGEGAAGRHQGGSASGSS